MFGGSWAVNSGITIVITHIPGHIDKLNTTQEGSSNPTPLNSKPLLGSNVAFPFLAAYDFQGSRFDVFGALGF